MLKKHITKPYKTAQSASVDGKQCLKKDPKGNKKDHKRAQEQNWTHNFKIIKMMKLGLNIKK